MSTELEVKKLSPELLDDWLKYFDEQAFSDNPGWSSCYCYFHHADHRQHPWQERLGEDNRAAVIELINNGKLEGFVAYHDDEVVGWCHAAPRLLIPNLQRDTNLLVQDLDKIGSIVCFIVHPDHRREGVARSLLEEALRSFQERGLMIAEAYPNQEGYDDASHYHGPLSLYQEVGFTIFRELDNLLIVRKALD